MSEKYLKAAIRFDKIHTRSLKISYSNLTPIEKRFIKLIEQQEQIFKDLDRFWKYSAVYDSTGKVDQDKTNWDLFYVLDAERDKIERKIRLFIERHQINDEKVIEKHKQYNRCRFYGGSY